MFASKTVARCAFRRQVLHWSAWQSGLLPSNLPSANGERKECPLFSDGCRCGGSRLSSVPPLPAGMFSRNSGLVGNFEYRLAGFAPNRGERVGSGGDGISGRAPRCRFAAFAPPVHPASGRDPECRCSNPAFAFREEVDRRNKFTDEPTGLGCRFRLRAKIQCCDPQDLQASADSNSAAVATEDDSSGESIHLSSSFSSSLSLAGNIGISRSPRNTRRRSGEVWPLSSYDFRRRYGRLF